MWGHADTTTSHNRGAVADPANEYRRRVYVIRPYRCGDLI